MLGIYNNFLNFELNFILAYQLPLYGIPLYKGHIRLTFSSIVASDYTCRSDCQHQELTRPWENGDDPIIAITWDSVKSESKCLFNKVK